MEDDESFLTLIPSIRFKQDGTYYTESMEQYFNDLEELEKIDEELTSYYNNKNTDSNNTGNAFLTQSSSDSLSKSSKNIQSNLSINLPNKKANPKKKEYKSVSGLNLKLDLS